MRSSGTKYFLLTAYVAIRLTHCIFGFAFKEEGKKIHITEHFEGQMQNEFMRMLISMFGAVE